MQLWNSLHPLVDWNSSMPDKITLWYFFLFKFLDKAHIETVFLGKLLVFMLFRRLIILPNCTLNLLFEMVWKQMMYWLACSGINLVFTKIRGNKSILLCYFYQWLIRLVLKTSSFEKTAAIILLKSIIALLIVRVL